MPTHVIYIDDSGNKEYALTPAAYDMRRGKSRYFVFCGALLNMADASRLTSTLVRLKLDCFGDDAVEIKSNWLRIRQEREFRYLNAYEMSDERLNEFMENYYTILNDSPLVLIAAIVDKLHMQEDYGSPWYAPAVAYELVLQRVRSELSPTDSLAVIIDDMTGATPKGNQYKTNLKKQHARLKRFGGQLREGDFSFLHSQRFVSSAGSHIVQLADVAAYNVHRQFMDYGDQWEHCDGKTLPMYDHFGRISTKFRCDANGRVQGYGIVKFPLRNRIRWKKPDAA